MVSVILKNWVIFVSKSVEKLTKGIVAELNDTIVVLDTETTGFSQYKDRIVEFGAIKLTGGKVVDTMSILINPRMDIPQSAISVHGITNKMVENEPDEEYYLPKIINFINGASYIVGHNVSFDIRFLEQLFKRYGYSFDCEYIDTLKFAKQFYPNALNHKLTTLAEYLNIDIKEAHRALADVETTVWLLRYLAYEVMQK